MKHPHVVGGVENLFGPLDLHIRALAPYQPVKPPPPVKHGRVLLELIDDKSFIDYLALPALAEYSAQPRQHSEGQDVFDILAGKDKCLTQPRARLGQSVPDILTDNEPLPAPANSPASWKRLFQQSKDQDVADILASTDRCFAVVVYVFERLIRDLFGDSEFLMRSTATWLATEDNVRISDGVRYSEPMPASQVSFTPHWYLAATGLRYQDWLLEFKTELRSIARRKSAVERCTPQQARKAYLAIKRAHSQEVLYVSTIPSATEDR